MVQTSVRLVTIELDAVYEDGPRTRPVTIVGFLFHQVLRAVAIDMRGQIICEPASRFRITDRVYLEP